MAKNALPSRFEHRDDVAPLCTFSSLVHVLHALPNGARPVASRLRVVRGSVAMGGEREL